MNVPSSSDAGADEGTPHLVKQILQQSVPEGRSLLQHALRTIRSHFGMDVAFVSEFRPGERVLRRVDVAPHHTPVIEGHSDPLETTYCQRIVDGRVPQVIPDVMQHPELAALAVTGSLSIGSYLGVPVRRRSGEVYGTFCCFSSEKDPSLDERDARLMELFATFISTLLEQELTEEEVHRKRMLLVRSALEGDLLGTVYQPIVHLAAGQVVGYEALARFNAEPRRPPNEWFADAAAVGMGDELELKAIETAVKALPDIPGDAYLSLNVSPETLLAGGVGSLLRQHPLGRLVLEITEHAHIEDYEPVLAALEPLRARGLRVAVDDAGAGFASFRHILKLKPDVIKLDSSLISRIDRDPDARALAAALVRFAEETSIKVVAEGVETEEELKVLQELKVNKVQGYLVGRPGPLPAKVQADPKQTSRTL